MTQSWFRTQSAFDSPRFALVARATTATNRDLLRAAGHRGYEAAQLCPDAASGWLERGDIALGRLDVLPSLDGPEAGFEALRRLEHKGVTVLNRPGAVLAAHDKLVTALRLAANGLPHPRTAHVGSGEPPDFEFPVVVKPRFGSWGRDVRRCTSRSGLRRYLRKLGGRPWFERQGALVQELVATPGRDLRLVVAAGEVVGAIERMAKPGEWRTNVALGATRRPVEPPPAAAYLATRAAEAIGADLVGVDLLPDGDGGWIVLELNGAVDFTDEYAIGGGDVFERAVGALACSARRLREEPAVLCQR